MTFARLASLVGVALLVMIANVGATVLYMVVYSYLIDPGHDEQYYRAHVAVAAPWCSIVAGIPLMLLAGWWVGSWGDAGFAVRAALVVWLAYAIIDFAVLMMAGMTPRMAVIFTVSMLTKLAAVYAGARFAGRGA